MSQPPPYDRAFSFTEFQAKAPSQPPPGDQLDAELDGVELTVASIRANLAKIQRDDGKLQNQSVGVDQLTAGAILALGNASNVSQDLLGAVDAAATLALNARDATQLIADDVLGQIEAAGGQVALDLRQASVDAVEAASLASAYAGNASASEASAAIHATNAEASADAVAGAATAVGSAATQAEASAAAAAASAANAETTVQTVSDFADSRSLEAWASDAAYNIDRTGASDVTAGLIALFEAGGQIYFPEGDYLIAGAGADAGGAYAEITKNLHVRCHPNARFFTDDLDNDLIRLTVPSDGAGLPDDGIVVKWEGGIFDQRAQKRSTSVPFSSEWPVVAPVLQGSSATATALSIRGDYAIGGVPYYGVKTAEVSGVRVIAGDHWITAGGDEGIFIGGCQTEIVRESTFIGSRDLGIYFSGDSINGTLRCKSISFGNTYINCFGGVSQKRSGGDVSFTGETFINCPRPTGVEHLLGGGASRVLIKGNTFVNCNCITRLTYCKSFEVSDNKATDHGALEDDGTTPVGHGITNNVGFAGIWLRGCDRGVVRGNDIASVEAGFDTAYAGTGHLLLFEDYDPGSGAVGVTNTICMDNSADFMRRMGADTAKCANNRIINNQANNAVISSFVFSGTNSTEVRLLADMTPSYRNAQRFADGSVTLPIITRETQDNTGIFFAASKVGIAAAGFERFAANSTGVGFYGSAPVARPVVTGSRGGNAALSSLLTALANLGLIANSTTA